MSALHMETERVRQAARQLERWASSLLSSASFLRASSGRLFLAHQGDDFRIV